MGYNEAVRDNIRIERPKSYYAPTLFYPLCYKCGAEVMTYKYLRSIKYQCKKCRTLEYMQDKEKRTEINNDAKEKKFENAVARIRNITKNFQSYDDAIEKVHKILNTDGYFQSTEEIMVAIELEKNNIPYRHQVKFGIYRADFVLDKKKIVLEVDGTLFHTENTQEKENLRDNLICISLGTEWEVIRITDKLINQNITRLVKAIDTTYKERRKTRSLNGGMLPEWYTKRKI